MKSKYILIAGITCLIACLCIAPVSASLGDDLINFGMSGSSSSSDDSSNTPTYTHTYTWTDEEGNDYNFTVTYDPDDVSSFKNQLKPLFNAIQNNVNVFNTEFDRTNWTDDMTTSAVETITNNTNWTPDERLEMECYIMGWWNGLEEGREYIDARERLEMEQYMEAEQEAIEKGEEFDPESVVYDYSSLGAIPDICKDSDGNYDPSVCNAKFDTYMNTYFAHYLCTGDYGRTTSDPF